MRFLKLAFISAIVLFVVVTAIASLLPSKVLVSRAVDIRGSVQKAHEQIYNLNNWQNWMTNAKGEKAEYVYDSRSNQLKLGATKINVLKITDTTFVTNWSSSTEMIATFRIIDHHTKDSLFTVQWQMEQNVKWYPWQKFAAITKDEIWGASMEKSLDNLKSIVEAQ